MLLLLLWLLLLIVDSTYGVVPLEKFHKSVTKDLDLFLRQIGIGSYTRDDNLHLIEPSRSKAGKLVGEGGGEKRRAVKHVT